MPHRLTPLASLDEVRRLTVDSTARLHSATHEEILAGVTTDVYFVRTLEILRGLGLAETPVVAEIFASRDGVLAGVEEVRYLLRDSGVRIESLREGDFARVKETQRNALFQELRGSNDEELGKERLRTE